MNETDSNEVALRFGEFIKEGRLKKSFTQAMVANSLGVSQSYYQRIESGSRTVDLFLAMRICRVLELDLNCFLDSYSPNLYTL